MFWVEPTQKFSVSMNSHSSLLQYAVYAIDVQRLRPRHFAAVRAFSWVGARPCALMAPVSGFASSERSRKKVAGEEPSRPEFNDGSASPDGEEGAHL